MHRAQWGHTPGWHLDKDAHTRAADGSPAFAPAAHFAPQEKRKSPQPMHTSCVEWGLMEGTSEGLESAVGKDVRGILDGVDASAAVLFERDLHSNSNASFPALDDVKLPLILGLILPPMDAIMAENLKLSVEGAENSLEIPVPIDPIGY